MVAVDSMEAADAEASALEAAVAEVAAAAAAAEAAAYGLDPSGSAREWSPEQRARSLACPASALVRQN